jgi:hypothetical protein
MTRRRYIGCVDDDPRQAEVLRLLDRYLVEIVETYELCPWARAARTGGELATAVVWGPPTVSHFVTAAAELLARPTTRVAMVIAPEFSGDLRALRDRVAAALPAAGVADFHPDAQLDLATPARLVPFLRRSPDPLLQLVPLALLESARGATPPRVAERATQAQLLADHNAIAAPRQDAAARIAAANHARVTADGVAITAVLDDIADDRARSYARAGIAISASPTLR